MANTPRFKGYKPEFQAKMLVQRLPIYLDTEKKSGSGKTIYQIANSIIHAC